MEASLIDTSNELLQASAVYQQLISAKQIAATTKSKLDIAEMDIDSLKEELAEVTALNELLLQKKFS